VEKRGFEKRSRKKTNPLLDSGSESGECACEVGGCVCLGSEDQGLSAQADPVCSQ
jgi:hypothetical protein